MLPSEYRRRLLHPAVLLQHIPEWNDARPDHAASKRWTSASAAGRFPDLGRHISSHPGAQGAWSMGSMDLVLLLFGTKWNLRCEFLIYLRICTFIPIFRPPLVLLLVVQLIDSSSMSSNISSWRLTHARPNETLWGNITLVCLPGMTRRRRLCFTASGVLFPFGSETVTSE